MGFPIRKFTDQSPFAAPHDLSQRTTSFIASQRQGIHRILLRHLIALIIDAAPRQETLRKRPAPRLCKHDAPARSRTRTPRGARSVKTSCFKHTRGHRGQAVPTRLRTLIPAPPASDAPNPQTAGRSPRNQGSRHRTPDFPRGKSDMFSFHDITNHAQPHAIGRGAREDFGSRRHHASRTTDDGRTSSAIAPCRPQPSRRMVEPDGIEPTTSCLQSTRSPN